PAPGRATPRRRTRAPERAPHRNPERAPHHGGSRAPARAPQRCPRRSRRRRRAGFTLLELIVSLAILAVVTAVALPAVLGTTARLRLRSAAGEVATALRAARLHAVRHATHVAVRLETGGPGAVRWMLYRDGDGDGVLSRDIAAGTDPAVEPPPAEGLSRDFRFGAGVRLGFPDGPPPRDPGGRRRLTQRHDPVRFGRSDMASFGPLGTGTPGTIYLTDGRELACVRVEGRSARIRVLFYDRETRDWR
ncbi:MAG TPA: GspH/FimT family pseudopilin, partial [Thermoanaerobaculia bacterium]|nr:GspH/FimT family pseudopilin [Thermoanaerobaculia bacterium]